MNAFKRLTSFVLSIAVLGTLIFVPDSFNTAVAATETTYTTNNTSGSEEIFYSDLFYGYGSYLNDPSLSEFHLKTQNAMSNVFTEYVNSDAFGWAGFSETLNLFSSMSDLAKAYSDYFGLTDFQYEDDLDAANVKFASQLFELKMDVGDGISDIGKTNSQIKGVISTIKKLFEARENDELILSESITLILSDTATYCEYTATLIPSLNKYVIEYLDKLAEPLDTADEIFDFCSALAVAIAMEDIRISLIEDIIASQEKDTILYEGMTRLRGQLKNGYVGYFVETYLTNKVIDEIAKGVTKNITNILLGSANAICGAVTSTVGLINDIVFDWILGDSFATIEDYRVTMILSQYSDLLYDGLINKQSEFTKSFAVDQIFSYEVYFDAYLSATKFALEQCVKLTNYNSVYTNEYINGYISVCENYSYQQYVANIKDAISSIPFAERRITEFDEWIIDSDVALEAGTNAIESHRVYFVNNRFATNFKPAVDTIISVASNEKLVLQGNIAYYGASGSAYLDVDGELEVTGDIMYGTWGSVRIRMSNPNAVIKVGGNLLHKDSRWASEITGGTIVFNGDAQQRVNHLEAKNIIVDNPAGIIYDSIIHLYGHFDPNGNPIDDNDYFTYVYAGATFEEETYPKLYIVENLELNSSMRTDLYLDNDIVLAIPSGKDVRLDGSIKYYGASGSAYLDVDGELEVTGDIMYGTWGSVRIRMSNPNAVIKVGGNLLHKDSRWASEITGGTIVFNGDAQQRVNHLEATKIVIENSSPDGIIFESPITSTLLFNHNGNNFSLYADGTGSSFVDYDNDGIRDDKDPYPIIPVGDISDDTIVDTVDRMVLSRCLASWEGYSETDVDVLTADVNGDGVTDTLDRMILSRYLANWAGYESLSYST